MSVARLIMLPRILLLGILLFGTPLPGLAKMYEQPRSFSLGDSSQDKVDLKMLQRIDIERLRREDRERRKDQQHPGPTRFAVSTDVDYDLKNSGTWGPPDLPDGRLWRLRIQCPNAESLNLGITRFDMPQGAKLWIYDPEHSHVEGPYTSRDRSYRGQLWTPLIGGNEIIVEIFVPAGVSEPDIEIGKVNQGYYDLTKGGLGGTEGACNVDVVCPAGNAWRKQIRAVALLQISGVYACSGTLMNNTAANFIPYLLSAEHCEVDYDSADTVVAYWNYQSPTCGTHGQPPWTDSTVGGSFVHASYKPSDFLLLRLVQTPDPSFNVFYSGWNATDATPASTVGIHHPQGDVKAISKSNSAPDMTAYLSNTHDPAGNHWRVLWDLGITEDISSGSCLFEAANNRCIGQLHGGGFPMCEGTDLHDDYYGRLSVSWEGGGTPATRLRDWLDPVGGTLTLDGMP